MANQSLSQSVSDCIYHVTFTSKQWEELSEFLLMTKALSLKAEKPIIGDFNVLYRKLRQIFNKAKSHSPSINVDPYNYFAVTILENMGIKEPNNTMITAIEEFVRSALIKARLELIMAR